MNTLVRLHTLVQRQHPKRVTASQLATVLGVSSRTVRRHLSKHPDKFVAEDISDPAGGAGWTIRGETSSEHSADTTPSRKVRTMTAATAPAPTSTPPSNSPATAARPPLWMSDDINIPYLGVEGEFNDGKTLFLMEIAPPPWRAIYYGFEESATTFSTHAGITRTIEVPEEVGKTNPDYTAKDLWLWWEQHALSLPPGEFDAILIDTNGALQDGLPELISSRYADYGYESEHKFRSTKGLFWGHVKNHLEATLKKVRQRTGVQTIAWASHMKQEWKGGSPTSARIPEGLEIWKKLATLEIRLSRKPYLAGKQSTKLTHPEAPVGTVVKGRLAIPVRDENGQVIRDKYGDATWKTVHPPKIVDCTPGKIRRYIESPPDWGKLKESEKLQTETMTDDERLQMQAQIAADQRAAAEAELEAQETSTNRLKRAAAIQKQQQAAAAREPDSTPAPAAQPQSSTPPTEEAEPVNDKPADRHDGVDGRSGEPINPPGQQAKQKSMEAIMALKASLKLTDQQFSAVLAKRGVNTLADLTPEQAEELRLSMRTLQDKKDMKSKN